MTSVRLPAVAGMFYPADPVRLEHDVDGMLAAARTELGEAPASPKALIAPHAGHRYSGLAAARAYVRADPARIRRVVLLGPTHRVGIRGIALSGHEAFATPLGEVPVDAELVERVLAHPAVVTAPRVHAEEHSLEVHLPFLQRHLRDWTLLPLAVGDVAPDVVAEVLDAVWGDDDTVLLVSSDLSHFEPYSEAREHDARTIERLLRLDGPIGSYDACGVRPVNGLLVAAARRGLEPELLDYYNSGDTEHGDRDRVVGYASLAFHAAPGEGTTHV